VAADEAEAEAAGEDAAPDALGELAADVDELEEELQPAASPMKARPTTANRARVDR
jgi:outer membrane murein-binding lipoprotein Lpp